MGVFVAVIVLCSFDVVSAVVVLINLPKLFDKKETDSISVKKNFIQQSTHELKLFFSKSKQKQIIKSLFERR